MEKFLKKTTISNMAYSILFMVIGATMYSSPVATLSLITYIIEVVLVVIGAITIINYVRVESVDDAFSCGFIQGLACILLALFLIANPKSIHSILPVVIGIWMVIGSFARIQVGIKLEKFNEKASVWYIIIAILMFTLGLVVICNPFKAATVIIQLLGIAIVAYSAFDIIENTSILRILNKKK